MSLDIDVQASLEAIKNNTFKLTWTRLSQYQDCEAKWLSSSFLKFVDPISSAREDSRAIAGWAIQKIFEHLINLRKYRDPQSLTWLKEETAKLLDTIIFIQSDQYKIPDSRHFFKTKEGQQRIEQTKLDPKIGELQCMFLDEVFFAKVWGTTQNLKDKINSLYATILEKFKTLGINLDQIIAEPWIKAKIPNVGALALGRIDFLFDPHSPFINMNNLGPSPIVMDGKFNTNEWTKVEQLQFYGTILNLQYNRIPKVMSLIDWGKAKIISYRYDPSYIKKMIEFSSQILFIQNLVKEYLETLHSSGTKTIEAQQIPIKWNPTRDTCMFCDLRKHCDIRESAGIKTEELYNIVADRQAKKELRAMHPDPSTPVDITL